SRGLNSVRSCMFLAATYASESHSFRSEMCCRRMVYMELLTEFAASTSRYYKHGSAEGVRRPSARLLCSSPLALPGKRGPVIRRLPLLLFPHLQLRGTQSRRRSLTLLQHQ